MAERQGHKYRNFKEDLENELNKSSKARLIFQIESAKLAIARKLVYLRESLGLTQSRLARQIGVSQQLVSKVESGHDNITIETLIKFLNVLGVVIKVETAKRSRIKNRAQEILKIV